MARRVLAGLLHQPSADAHLLASRLDGELPDVQFVAECLGADEAPQLTAARLRNPGGSQRYQPPMLGFRQHPVVGYPFQTGNGTEQIARGRFDRGQHGGIFRAGGTN
ncbi:hypothetical protein D3C71_1411430 [compost metagenome]